MGQAEREKWAGAAGLVVVKRRAWVSQGVGALAPCWMRRGWGGYDPMHTPWGALWDPQEGLSACP